jgi:hypothetical protein
LERVLQVLDEKWTAAEADLSMAFKLCDPKHTRNAGAILSYLVPVQILRGHLPRQEMLKRYGLLYFKPIIEALKVGNPVQLQAALDKEQRRFMRVRADLSPLCCMMVCSGCSGDASAVCWPLTIMPSMLNMLHAS